MIKNNEITGTIINIQRFCIHDGPGIRTTVFVKGCNLRCLWCHNPESQSFKPQRMFFKNKCINCRECEKVCSKAFAAQCNLCGKCVKVCRRGAREISGRVITSKECMQEIEKDKDFYITSGGGVTFSGGEPLLQYEFLTEMLKQCKERHINTAIETAGCVEWERIEVLLPYLDCILYDIKAIDEEVHERLTGVSNKLILQNAEKLMRVASEKLLFRMPVIPDYNDMEFDKIAKFVSYNSLELLPYHEIGIGKYEALNMKYQLYDAMVPTLKDMREMTDRYEHVFSIYNG